jgi:hypothetical protein
MGGEEPRRVYERESSFEEPREPPELRDELLPCADNGRWAATSCERDKHLMPMAFDVRRMCGLPTWPRFVPCLLDRRTSAAAVHAASTTAMTAAAMAPSRTLTLAVSPCMLKAAAALALLRSVGTTRADTELCVVLACAGKIGTGGAAVTRAVGIRGGAAVGAAGTPGLAPGAICNAGGVDSGRGGGSAGEPTC